MTRGEPTLYAFHVKGQSHESTSAHVNKSSALCLQSLPMSPMCPAHLLATSCHLHPADAKGERARAEAPAPRGGVHSQVVQVPVGAQRWLERVLLPLLAGVGGQQPVRHARAKAEGERQQPLPHHLPRRQLAAAGACAPMSLALSQRCSRGFARSVLMLLRAALTSSADLSNLEA